MAARSIVDDFLDGLREVATEFVADFVEDRFTPIIPPQQKQPRRKNIKPPKVKTPKTPKPAKREAQGPTLYDVLQISKTADAEIVTAAWKAACRKHHPDTGHGNAKKMAEINAAYEILKDPIKRREYDRQLREAK